MSVLCRILLEGKLKPLFLLVKFRCALLYKPKDSLWHWRPQNGTVWKARPCPLWPLWPALLRGLPQQCECTWVHIPPVWDPLGDSCRRPFAASENMEQMKILCDSIRSKCQCSSEPLCVSDSVRHLFRGQTSSFSLNTNKAFFFFFF